MLAKNVEHFSEKTEARSLIYGALGEPVTAE